VSPPPQSGRRTRGGSSAGARSRSGDDPPDRDELWSEQPLPARDSGPLRGRAGASLRNLRLDPGRRSALIAVGAAVLAALIASVVTWHAKPTQRPLGGPISASGAISAVSAVPTTAGGSAGGDPPGATPPAGSAASPPSPATMSTAGGAPLVVSVAGEVRRPGLVRLPAGARVADAVRAAGGPTTGAAIGLLNLAAPLTDGSQVVVAGASSAVLQPDPGAGSAAGGVAGTSAGGLSGPVDLNTATLADLDTLPGVGPVTAQKILDWRQQHGRFGTIDELREIPGIGEARFAQLAPRVTV
jgi:competence protein ComEA